MNRKGFGPLFFRTTSSHQSSSGVHRIAKSAAIANDKPSMSNESSALASAATEADRVVKRQKICSTKFADAVDGLLAAVNDSRNKLQDRSTEHALTDLKQHVTQLGVSSELHDQTKQLHGAIAKLGKVLCPSNVPKVSTFGQSRCTVTLAQALEKAFVPDICKATRPVEFDQDTLNQVGN